MSLPSNLDYDSFRQYALADRIEWIDCLDTQQVKEAYESRIVKRFFSKLFEDDPNTYLRQRGLEYLCELTLLEAVRFEYTKDFLLEEAASTGNTHIDCVRLRWLFLLFGDVQECYRVFEKESQSQDFELASEARYRVGLIHLIYRVNQASTAQAVAELKEAKKWFDSAQKEVENRLDARFFGVTSDYLLALLGFQSELAEEHYNELGKILWERRVWGYLPDSSLLEYRIFKCLSGFRSMICSTTRESYWTDYKKELSLLCSYFNDLLLKTDSAIRLDLSVSNFKGNPVRALLTQYYVHNLSASQVKIDAILADTPHSEIAQINFLTDLSDRLSEYREKKNDDSLSTVAALCSGFDWMDPARIVQDVVQLKEIDTVDLSIRASLAIRYAKEQQHSQVSYLTGYSVGDEIVSMLITRVKSLIPSYPIKEFAIFTSVLSDLVRYAYQAETQPKEFFPYLYDPGVKLEASFQKPLFERLTAGERASNYHYEESDLVGASRLDIVYRDQQVVFPIEIKKTDIFPSWESVKNDYVAQVQMYNRPYNQLGFLVIFERSRKADGKPLNDIRSLVEILHLTPFYPVPEKFPNFVVALIIPANKVRPSNYTKYK